MNEYFTYLLQLSADEWKTKVNEQWSIKDVVAHLIGWQKECAKQIPIIWQTKQPPWFVQTNNWDDFNQKSIEVYKNYSPSQLLDEWQFWQQKIDKEVAKIGDAKMQSADKLFDWYFEGTDFDKIGVDHYTEHLNQVKEILGE